jgi:O-antigen/teichoic acid export membrane protein
MKKYAKKALQSPIIYGSTIVIFGNLFANFFNFLFNLFMTRNLAVADYGILASIMSLISYPSLLAINPVVVRFAGDYFVKGELDLVRGIYIKFFKFFFILGVIFFILFLININTISSFFHIADYNILILANIIIFFILLNITNLALLQAKLAFGYQVFVSFFSAAIKLVMGASLVLLGYKAFGGVAGLVMAAIGSFIVSFYPLRFVFKRGVEIPKIDTQELFRYGIPSAISLIALTSFISTDILLVKHLFQPEEAGLYAGLSLVARVIFFLTVPIGSVMFPIIVRKHSNNESFKSTFLIATAIVLIPSILITMFYFVFPEFAILFFLKNSEYLAVAPLLGFFAVYITLYCLLYLLATFYLSIKKTIVYWPILIGAILQMALIFVYHDSLQQVITISFTLTLLLVIGFLLYYPYATKR